MSRDLLPSLSVPKGGGSIRGIGETFHTDVAMGTGALAFPLAVTPGRAGFTPDLSVRYDSGAGNGPFGLGFRLLVPNITRKTDKGLPRYVDDPDDARPDVFILSSAEDLVPARTSNAVDAAVDVTDRGGYRITRYRPRVESAFVRIERWRHLQTGDTHWRAFDRANVLSTYGSTAASRVADPARPDHVFSWLLDETRDDRGNVCQYIYKAEDGQGVARGQLSELSRFDSPSGTFLATAQRYLKRIRYGNRAPVAREAPAPDNPNAWLFEVVLDYGEHDSATPTPDETRAWTVRPDPFSTFRSTFEVRSYRRCERALVFHRIPGLSETPQLVRSTDLAFAESHVRAATDALYDGGVVATRLLEITQVSYLANPDGTYQRATMPPLSLGFSEPVIHDTLETIKRGSLAGIPGADASRWVDLDGEGLPGLLVTTPCAWFYQANRGDGTLVAPSLERALPSPSELLMGTPQLVDLDGDGHLDLVHHSSSLAGYFERTDDHDWRSFVAFAQSPNLDWSDPNLRSIDLDGDGLPDILVTEDAVLRWYPSLGKGGYGAAGTVPKPHRDSDGPALVFADGTETIHLADMTGDGLVDLVRIRHDQVCYWPNLGFGRFGKKITLDGEPLFESYDRFEPQRVRLADIDGSGTFDVVYSAATGTRVWFNRSGNALSPALAIRSVPAIDPLSRLEVIDVLGTGTGCLGWSSALLAQAEQPVGYVNLLADGKPYLLTSFANNLGAETQLEYQPSTRFYLADLAAGRPWITRLPFPVHVVARIDRKDRVTGSTLVTRFAYHHGFYDGYERELRGFAMVEQWDAESFDGSAANEITVPPVHSKTWFHTGAWLNRERLEQQLAREYYGADSLAPSLSDSAVPVGLSTHEEREAARARRGQVLRQEIYGDDATPQAVHPYQATAYRHEVKLLQRASGASHAVFHARQVEAITLHYERDPSDPRTQHELALDVDDFGNVLRTVTIAYPRRGGVTPERTEQWHPWLTLGDRTFANRSVEQDWYRVGVIVEEIASELTGVAIPPTGVLTPEAIRAALAVATEITYETKPDPANVERRVITRTRHLYSADDLSGPLVVGAIESRALPYQSYQLAFTPGLVAQAFGTLVDAATLTEGGYVSIDALWWSPSERAVVDPAQFYLPVAAIDPFAQQHSVTYDPYALAVVTTRDALGNVTTAQMDYRVMKPSLVTDPNGNRVATHFDVLGLPVAIAIQGKQGSTDGDTLTDPTTRIEYDFHRWQTSGGTQPTFVHTFVREQHGAQNARWLETVTYTDGFAREVMTKMQAEPDPQSGAPRWIGTGRTIFDNKSNPVKRYEPFFSSTSDFESEAAVVAQGVTPLLHYDPLGRLIRTDFPDGTTARVVYSAWEQQTWDPNDCVTGSPWLARMQGGTAAEQRAATLTLGHASTPNVAHVDALGRAFLRIADAGAGGLRSTRVGFDVSGNTTITTDPRGIAIGTQTYDALGRSLHATMPDCGETRALTDVHAQPIRSWSARGIRHRRVYDALRRPTHLYSQESAGAVLLERTAYGESMATAEAIVANTLGRVVRVFDGAGVAATTYDFKGNVLTANRKLASNYDATLDWTPLAALASVAALDGAATSQLSASAADGFTMSTTYDALNHVTSTTSPDGSTTRITYNEARLLERIDVQLQGAQTTTPFVTRIDYNARSERTFVTYGNGTTTTYGYDPLTFHLASVGTKRDSSGFSLQDLTYTYDAVGNVVEVKDAVEFGNANVAGGGLYEYDALYQLTQVIGREHPGQQPTAADSPLVLFAHPEDLQSLRQYREQYSYDVAGNVLAMAHVPLDNTTGWTRRYSYAADSNRLLGTSLPGDGPGIFSATYTHDAHGNMTSMPHLAELRWDHADRLVAADLGGGGTTYFVYDSSGQRVRKVYEHGGVAEERVYLGAFELYRKRNAASGVVALERATVHVMDDKARVALVERTTVDTSVAAFTPTVRQRYQLAEQLGSSVFELDETAGVITYEEYFAFGGTAFRAANSATDVSAKRYRYAGLERDEETGLDYATARYYAAWLGRWTASDPISLQGGANQFQYCGNNPIVRSDPAGTDWGWLNPSNWCNPFASDCEIAAVEIANGAGEAVINMGKTTGARVVDMTTMEVSAIGKATGLYDVGYTEWSPEAKNYDPEKTLDENQNANLYNNTIGGVVQVAKGVYHGDLKSIGQAGVMVALARAGARGGPPNPTIAFRVPALALARSVAGDLVPVVVSKTVSVTIPASQALAAAGAGAAMMSVGGTGGGSGGRGSGSKGVVAKSIGGTKPIPPGTNLTLGLVKSLVSFTEQFAKNTVHVWRAYDLGYFVAGLNSRSVVAGELSAIARVIIDNGGRLKFNLEGLSADKSGITTAELETVLSDRNFESNTDFFVGRRQVTGPELEGLLKPWRNK